MCISWIIGEDKNNQTFLRIQSEIQMTYAKTQNSGMCRLMTYAKTQKMTVLGLGVCYQPTDP